MKQILCLFDYGPECYTGYATVTRNLVKYLKAHFNDQLKLDIIAVNYFGKGYIEYDGTVRVISGKMEQDTRGIPQQFKHGDDFGRMQFSTVLRDNDYDGIFILLDLGLIAPFLPMLRQLRDQKRSMGKGFNSMIYFPVDGLIHPRLKNNSWDKAKLELMPKDQRHYFSEWIEQVKELDFFDRVVTYTNYGKKELARHEPELSKKIEVIYHGTNTTDFFPMGVRDKRDFRREYFGINANKVIIGVINRNQPRKDIPTAIFGFIEAMESYPAPDGKEYFLYLHMAPEDPKGWRLRDLLNQTKLKEGVHYMFPRYGDQNSQVLVEILNKIYNSLDIYLSTATGGGWELTVTEAMACKVPCIIPKHTSFEEIGANGRALFLEELLPVSVVDDNVKRFMCHYDEVGEAIQKVAYGLSKEDKAFHQPNPEIAYDWVTKLSWENVCKKWIDNFTWTYSIYQLPSR